MLTTLIVHKDADAARQLVGILMDDHNGEFDKLHDVGGMPDAMNLGTYDVALLDLVTLAGKPLRVRNYAADEISSYLRMNPTTRIVLFYSVGRGTAEFVVDQVREVIPDAQIDLLDCMADIDEIRRVVTGAPVVPFCK